MDDELEFVVAGDALLDLSDELLVDEALEVERLNFIIKDLLSFKILKFLKFLTNLNSTILPIWALTALFSKNTESDLPQLLEVQR